MAGIEDFRGKWALVTGASSGIGVALARELAKQGANLILTARRRERLETLAAEVGAKGIATRIVVADLNDTAAPQQIYDATEGAGLTVDILINNAGLGQYGPFYSSRFEQDVSQVRVNCEAVMRVSRLFVERMIERRRGWILITSSVASFQPLPYLSIYAATKAFDRLFALGLAEEVAGFGVKVTALCPGPTEAEFSQVAGTTGAFSGMGSQSAEDVAQKAVAALASGRRTIVPNFKSAFTAFIVRFLPTGLITKMVAKRMRPRS
jgi:short-subunit dehydrogenase